MNLKQIMENQERFDELNEMEKCGDLVVTGKFVPEDAQKL
jgi:hypothetical protein